MSASEHSVRALPTVILVSENGLTTDFQSLLSRLVPKLAAHGYKHFLCDSPDDYSLEQVTKEVTENHVENNAQLMRVTQLTEELKAHIATIEQDNGLPLAQYFLDFLRAKIEQNTEETSIEFQFYNDMLRACAVFPNLPAKTVINRDFLTTLLAEWAKNTK